MTISRRFLLGGLLAAPAIVAVDSLMPLRGIKFDPIVRLQTWPLGEDAYGAWWTHEGPLSKVARVEAEMRAAFGEVYSETIERPVTGPSFVNRGYEILGPFQYTIDGPIEASRCGVRPTKEERAEHHRLSVKGIKIIEHVFEDGATSGFRSNSGATPLDFEVTKRGHLYLKKNYNSTEALAYLERAEIIYENNTQVMIDRLETMCQWGV